MKENIEEVIERLEKGINDVWFSTLYSQEDEERDLQILLSDYKRVLKENEELNNRCRNLDKEAQAYLEELAGDNTLTRRTIKQLQEENEELKIKNNAIKRKSEAYAENIIRLDNELNLEKEKSKYEWIRQNCLSQKLVNKLYIPNQKIKGILNEINKEYIKQEEIFNKKFEKENIDMQDYYIQKEAICIMQELGWIEGKLQELLESED